LRIHAGDSEGADRLLEEAALVAEASGSDELGLGTATRLAFHLGVHQDRLPEAVRWSRSASAKAERLWGVAPLRALSQPLSERHAALLKDLLVVQGKLEAKQGDFQKALIHLRASLDLQLKRDGVEDPGTARTISALGSALIQSGDLNGGRQQLERAQQVFERAFGAEHPATAQHLLTVGEAYRMGGDNAKAVELFEQSFRALQGARGSDHAETGAAAEHLGEALLAKGEPQEAVAKFELALKVHRRMGTLESPRAVRSLVGLGEAELSAGRNEAAVKHLEEALRLGAPAAEIDAWLQEREPKRRRLSRSSR
jgi:tetratricopeptide (TPR) repeat protein